MKQFKLSFFLTLLMSMAGLQPLLAQTFKYNGIYYRIMNGDAWVTYGSTGDLSENGTSYTGDVVIPESITVNDKVYNVTKIDNYAFIYCSGVTSITIPSSVTSIGDCAFLDCSSLSTIIIPNSVKEMGSNALGGTTWYDNQPDGMVYAGEIAYCYKGTMPPYTTITLRGGTLGIAAGAFVNCIHLKSISIPNSVTYIGKNAFQDCHNLVSIDIPNGVNIINNYTFYCCWNLKSVTIPNSVTTIGEYAFYNCIGLSTITIPASVTSFGAGAFRDCIPLASVISESETPPTITAGTFSNCPNAILMVPKNSISNYQEASNWNSSFTEIKAIQQTINLSEIPTKTYGDAQYTLPQQSNEGLPLTWAIADNNIGSISGNILTFNNAGTTTVTATQAGNDFYDSFTKDYTLTVNKARLDVTANDYTIQQGASLPSYEVTYNGFKKSDTENDLTTKPVASCSASSSNTVGTYDIVGGGGVAQNYEFYYTNGTLTIGSPIINFADQYAKSACVAAWDTNSDGELSMQEAAAVTSLSSATFDKNMTSFDELVYFTSLTSIISFQSYTKLTSIVIPNNVTSIPYRAFWGCTNLNSVTVPNSVTSIGSQAFYNCRNLLSINIPNGVTSIGYAAFNGCRSLTTVTIPNGINIIEGDTFSDCISLTSISSIPNSVTSIGVNAFRNCTSLANVTIPNSVVTIGQYAFASTGLTSVIIPSSVTSIGDCAFAWCNNIASISVENGNGKYDSRDNCNAIINTSTNKLLYGSNNTTIPNSVTSIGESAFSNREGLTSITIPNSVTSIGESVFYGCSGLTSVTIPNSVTSIGESAFSGCSGLTSVTIPNSVTSIGQSAFSGCSGLISVSIPNSVTSIGYTAFSNCSSLISVTIPNSVTSIGNYAFNACSNLTSMTVRIDEPLNLSGSICGDLTSAISLYVPAGSVNAYKAADYWKNFKEVLAIVKNEQTLELTVIPAMTYGDATYTLPETTEEGRALTWTVANTNVATVSANVLTIHGAGLTTVTATNVGDDNYEDFSREFGLVVNKASLAISATNKSMTYSDDVPSLEIEYNGFKNDETATVLTTQPSITCSATKTSNVGVYEIQVSGATAANYDITHIPGTMTINKAPLTITAKSYTINQKDNLPEFGVTYDGFKNDETSSVLTTLPTITCDATDSETAGEYDITPSGATAMNYSFNYVKGTLTVNEVESVTIAMKTGSGDSRNMIAYSSKYGLDFTDRPELKAYIACGYNSKKEVMLVHVNVVPPYTGMVIKTTNGIYDGGEYDVPTTTEDYYYANLLVPVVETGTVTPTETIDDVEYTNFTIGTLDGGGIGFVKLTTNWTAHNKSYLRVPTSLYENTSYARAIRGFNVEFVEGEKATAILNAKHEIQEDEGDYYDLLGRKVKPNRQGLYIHKGKKVFIK